MHDAVNFILTFVDPLYFLLIVISYISIAVLILAGTVEKIRGAIVGRWIILATIPAFGVLFSKFPVAPLEDLILYSLMFILFSTLLYKVVTHRVFSNTINPVDALLVLSIGILTPILPTPTGKLMAVIPLASLLVSLLIVKLQLQMMTTYRPEFPEGYRHVVIKPMPELLRSRIIKYIPVYIDGYGFVHETSSNTVEQHIGALFRSTLERRMVYAVPVLPFFLYYGLVYTVLTLILTVVSIFEINNIIAFP